MSRIHAFSSEPTIQSLCSNLWRNRYWTSHWSSDRERFLIKLDLKLQFHQPMIRNAHLMLWFQEERFGSWMKFILMPYSDLVQNLSLNSRNLKEECLARGSQRLATRRFVRSMFQVKLAIRRFVRTHSAFFPAKRLLFHAKNHSNERKEVEGYSCQWFV